MEKQVVILEPSTNTHVLEAKSVESKDLGNSIKQMKIKGDGIVSHGEHGTLRTESENVIKYVQQELNPVTKSLQNAYD